MYSGLSVDSLLLGLVFAFVMDSLFADPSNRFHPVAHLGRYIAYLEHLLNKKGIAPFYSICLGGLLTLLVVCTSFGGAYLIMYFLMPSGVVAEGIVSGIFLFLSMAPQTLYRHAMRVLQALRRNDIGSARHYLSWIVGRDTKALGQDEIIRGVVETVAEGLLDGVLSPLFYFFLLGPIGAVVYRSINTMDSMLGHKEDKYLFFGRIPARLDDIFNFIPARIGAVLIVISAMLLGCDAKRAWHIWQRDGKRHPSPNSGHLEAAMAGALCVQLGGVNYYQGVPHDRETLGDKIESLKLFHILVSLRIMYVATGLMTVLGVFVLLSI